MIVLKTFGAGYAPRTAVNAKGALTLAVAIDFETAGEKLTKKVSGLYLPVTWEEADEPGLVAQKVVGLVPKGFGGPVPMPINVAGNGIYTLAKHGITQAEANRRLTAIIKQVSKLMVINGIQCGGQTGIDQAGAYAAIRLGIPLTATLPDNWLYRDAEGVDHESTRIETLRRFVQKD